MMETLCCTIKRVAPAMLTPPVKACLIDDRTANKIKATTIDNNVKIVRTFFRFRLLQISTKNFIRLNHQHPTSNNQRSSKIRIPSAASYSLLSTCDESIVTAPRELRLG